MNTFWKKYITSPVINAIGRRMVKTKFSSGPILIGGCGRSGTSLLLSMISAHPKVFTFPHEVDAHTSWIKKNNQFVPERIDRLHRYLIKSKVPKEVDRWCEKRPYNVRYIDNILTYYGNQCRFIHIVRDPRAVCTSYHPKKPNEYWVPIDRWVNDVSAGLKHSNSPQVFTLKYEDLITSTGQTIEALCSFLNLEYGLEMKNWLDFAKVKKNSAWFDELTNIHTDSLNKWKRTEHQSRVKEIIQHPNVRLLMEKLGYKG